MKGGLFILVPVLFIGGIVLFTQSELGQRLERERDEEIRRRQTPHVIREADGCKVYAFEAGARWHYFTRCPDSRTSTESTWEECRMVGKVRHCDQKSETIDAAR
jgi:hypothetical protein